MSKPKIRVKRRVSREEYELHRIAAQTGSYDVAHFSASVAKKVSNYRIPASRQAAKEDRKSKKTSQVKNRPAFRAGLIDRNSGFRARHWQNVNG